MCIPDEMILESLQCSSEFLQAYETVLVFFLGSVGLSALVGGYLVTLSARLTDGPFPLAIFLLSSGYSFLFSVVWDSRSLDSIQPRTSLPTRMLFLRWGIDPGRRCPMTTVIRLLAAELAAEVPPL